MATTMRAIKRAFSNKATERGWKPKRERDSFFLTPPSSGRELSVFESLRKCSKQRTSELVSSEKKKIFLDGKLHNKRERKA